MIGGSGPGAPRIGHAGRVKFIDPAPVHPRVHAAEALIARHGPIARRCFAALERGDPLADAVIAWLRDNPEWELGPSWSGWVAGEAEAEPVAGLFAQLRAAEDGLDWDRIDRARRLFERSGPFGGFVLSLRSLMAGYTSAAGTKPLAFSGRLREQAHRRVAETARFVTAVCSPEGLRSEPTRLGEGWRITAQVRLMHAQIRRLLLDSGRWEADRWAAPINQHDMLATMLLFSEVYVEGLRILGFDVSAEEAEDWIYLWSHVARLLGTEAELLPRDYAEAQTLRELIYASQGPADADGRALAEALLGLPPAVRLDQRLGPRIGPRLGELRGDLLRAASRMLIGDDAADQLGLAPTPGWSRALQVVPPVIAASERLRTRVPALEPRLRQLGAGYWRWIVEATLAGDPARFARPQRLA
jgi:hypothetical protein